MILALTQQGAILLCINGTDSIGSNSVPYMYGAKLKLVNSSTVTLNASTTWGSVSPNIGGYDGYADGTMSFAAPSVNSANVVEAVSTEITFRPTDSVDTVSAYGIVITDSGSSSVMFAAPFDVVPITLSSTLTQLQIQVRYNPAQPGASIVQTLY